MIQQAGFNIEDFEFKELMQKGDKTPTGWLISYVRGKDYLFKCDYGVDHFGRGYTQVRYQPGRSKYTEGQQHEGIQQQHGGLFSNWLSAVKHETSLDDLWETKLNTNTNTIAHYVNGKQIPNDIKFIKSAVKEIQEGISKLELAANVQQQINFNLNQTINFYENNKDFDWFGYILGTITSIIITMAVTPEQGKALWNMVGSVFRRLLGN